MFSLLVFLFGWALFRKIQDLQRLKKGFLIVAILSLCYGIIMEFVQESFVPNRSFDQWDIVADFVGCFIGCWRINKLSDRIKNKPL
jgi:VanZ family protein